MLKKSRRLRLDELGNHIAEDGADGVEALISGANVVEAVIIQQDLLHDEYGHRLAKLGASFHDAQAERDDLGGEEEVDDFGRVILDQGADNTQASQAQILEGARF